MTPEQRAAYICDLVADAPPLTDSQRVQIRTLLTSGRAPEQHHPQGGTDRGDSTPGRAPGRRVDSTSAA